MPLTTEYGTGLTGMPIKGLRLAPLADDPTDDGGGDMMDDGESNRLITFGEHLCWLAWLDGGEYGKSSLKCVVVIHGLAGEPVDDDGPTAAMLLGVAG